MPGASCSTIFVLRIVLKIRNRFIYTLDCSLKVFDVFLDGTIIGTYVTLSFSVFPAGFELLWGKNLPKTLLLAHEQWHHTLQLRSGPKG